VAIGQPSIRRVRNPEISPNAYFELMALMQDFRDFCAP
jgi:hypothetical protein